MGHRWAIPRIDAAQTISLLHPLYRSPMHRACSACAQVVDARRQMFNVQLPVAMLHHGVQATLALHFIHHRLIVVGGWTMHP